MARTDKSRCQDVDWAAAYDDLLPRIYNYFRYRVGGGPLAQDLTSATFERAWRSRRRYRPKRAALSTWMFTIARRVAADYFRRGRLELVPLEAIPELGAPETVERAVQLREQSRELGEKLARLDSRQRDLVALKYGAGMTNRAIAELTGLSESNVGTILYRVVEHLRAELGVTDHE
jgi:RNA polymerase sigma-70 factor (ECF subfamily)